MRQGKTLDPVHARNIEGLPQGSLSRRNHRRFAKGRGCSQVDRIGSWYKRTSPIRKRPPPQDPRGPQAQAYGRILGGFAFLFVRCPCTDPLSSRDALSLRRRDLIAASISDQYSIGPSNRRICTRCCFTKTNMIQVCSNFDSARVFFINTRPDEIRSHHFEELDAALVGHFERLLQPSPSIRYKSIYSVSPSIRPVCSRCCFTMTNMLQVCSKFH